MALLNPSVDLQSQAAALIESLAKGCSSQSNFGSFSCVPYDSAWVSMIQMEGTDGTKQWRFLECFQYVLDTQNTDGGWCSGVPNSEVDAILNTMASLLAMRVHLLEPLNSLIPADMDSRVLKAAAFLQTRFDTWDVKSSDHVGFEILVPSLLELLKEEGFIFKLRDQFCLNSLNEKKMKQFHPQMLYKHKQYTILHSLEALVGKIDFDMITHHKISGSIMASPSATAAYLIHSTKWDEDAERYLEAVISTGSGHGSGGIPSAFPTPVFELSWTLSTLLVSGFSQESLGLENLRLIGDFLEQSFVAGDGLLGFAPKLLADADDTAKTIVSLNLIERSVSPEQLISEFETTSHFKTYSTERNPSFSANCNVLCALLSMKTPNVYFPQILKATSFLCSSWWEGSCRDKWNITSQYPMMLLAQVLMRLLRLCDRNLLESLPDEIQNRIPIVLFQILKQTLLSQNINGSWNQSREISAYSVLTLISLYGLPCASSLQAEIDTAIATGRTFIAESTSVQPDNIWIEKVSYGSTVLCEAYCLSALNAPPSSTSWSRTEISLGSVPQKALNGFVQFFSILPLFAQESKWKLRASLIEGFLFLPLLKNISHDVFPRYEAAEENYLQYIPLTWTTTNSLDGAHHSAQFLEEMMVISMLNYQADEFMEAVVGKDFENDLEPIKVIIRSLCEISAHDSNGFKNGTMTNTDKIVVNGHNPEVASEYKALSATPSLESVQHTLQRFTNYVLGHPIIALSSASDQLSLRRELQTFLLAHVSHIEDNSRFSRQEFSDLTATFLSPRSTYYSWVHTTSADHTSCPYSFAFISCLTDTGTSDCFETSLSKYLAQDLCSHLAVMCRQYNDYGSVKRDRNERNLNSINFPEFHPGASLDYRPTDAELKDNLFGIAEFERKCLTSTMEKLIGRVPTRVVEMLRLFVGVTDLYGQIYVARDIGIASRKG